MNGAKQLTTKLEEAGKSLVPLLEGNLVDKVWGDGRPAPPDAPIRIHKMEHAGESAQDKLARMREEMTGQLEGCVLGCSVVNVTTMNVTDCPMAGVPR